MRMNWTGKQATGVLRQRLGRNLHGFDDVILDEARSEIGIQGPPRSLPGDPPHMDSRRLIDSLYDEVDTESLESRIGSTEEHAVYMEEGTDTVAARPWLEPAILNSVARAALELAK